MRSDEHLERQVNSTKRSYKRLQGPRLPWLIRTIVQLVWRFMGNPYWDDWLKENEALEESFAKPYVE